MGNSVTSDQNVFDVYNVDAGLFKQSKGQIQITNSSLAFEIKSFFTHKDSDRPGSTEPMVWPLVGIRRYGFHKNIFLFECGRRCPKGEGLYAFMTNKAKHLNESLHKAIINSTTQPCNLQPSVARENKNGKKLLTKIDSILTTETILNNEADSLNEREESNYDANTSTNRTRSYEESNTITDNTIYYSMSKVNNNQSLQAIDARSGYYVNEDVIRLPVNLNFLATNSEYNNYVNSDLIDPRILAITKKFTKQLKEHKTNNMASLNYVIPEKFVVTEKPIENDLNYIEQNHLDVLNKKSKNVAKKLDNDKQFDVIDYVVIDKDKTPAAQYSQKQIDNRRMEYQRFQKP